MVFGMCATRVIAFLIEFVKDITVVSNDDGAPSGSDLGGSEELTGPRFEEIVDEKKTN